MMNLNHAMVVLAVAEHGSVSRAATALRLSQPAVSRTVKELETQLGTKLFARSPKGVQLTAPGRALVAHARTVRDETLRTERLLGDLAAEPEGRLAVGLSLISAHAVIGAALTEVSAANPQARFEVVRRAGHELLQRLRAGDLDVAFVHTARAPGNMESVEGLEAHPLYLDEMVVVARPRHPLARRREVPLPELPTRGWILWSRDTPARLEVDETFRAHQMPQPEPAIETDSLPLVLAMVECSDLLTMLPRALAHAGIAARRLAMVPVVWNQTPRLAAMLTAADRPLRPLGRALADAVRRAARAAGMRTARG
jgi:DNA-binding transcriptional LysR family regulator